MVYFLFFAVGYFKVTSFEFATFFLSIYSSFVFVVVFK